MITFIPEELESRIINGSLIHVKDLVDASLAGAIESIHNGKFSTGHGESLKINAKTIGGLQAGLSSSR